MAERKTSKAYTDTAAGRTSGTAAAHEAPPKKKRGPVAGTEGAKAGGMAMRDKYGSEFFAKIGAKGGKSVRQRHGSEFYTRIGQKGGKATRERHGPEYYERIGRLGGQRAGAAKAAKAAQKAKTEERPAATKSDGQ
ncbi:MAG TPA: hypothetical protein VIC85_05235 [Ktedonobacterales bacterium]